VVIAESTYRSDKAGLVYGYVFAPGVRGHAIESEAAREHLADPVDVNGRFLWLHFNFAHAASKLWLREHIALPDAFYDALADHSSTRVEAVEDALLAVINDVEFFGAEASAAGTVTLYVTNHILVSARTTPLRSLDRLRESVKQGERFRSPVELLAHLLRDQADVLVDIVRDVTRKVDAAEDRIIAQKSASRTALGAMRRVLVRLQRLLAPEPAALFRLLNRPPAWLREEDVAELRHSAEELSQAVSDSAALVERIRLLQEELVALINEQTNQMLFVLTVVTVLALPLTIVPGLFGMNVGGVPFRDHSGGFWMVTMVIAAIVGLGAVLARTVYRRW